MEDGEGAASDAPRRRPLWRFFLTPLGTFFGAALAAVAGAAGLAVWEFAKAEVKPTPTLLVNVQTDPARWNEAQSNLGAFRYVVPRAPAAIGSPPPGQSWDWHSWAHEIGGVDNWTSIQLTLEAPGSRRVLVQGVWPEIVERRPPLEGTSVSVPAGGATPNVDVLTIDLDRDLPRAESDSSTDRRSVYTLAKGEVAVAYIDATTDEYDVEWRLKLGYVVDGRDYVRTIDDGGKPFRTTSERRARQYDWNGRRWVASAARG